MVTGTNQLGFFNSPVGQITIVTAAIIVVILIAWRYVF
jgi:hypothetical protein